MIFMLTESELFKAYKEQKEELLSSFALSFLSAYPSFPKQKADDFISSFLHEIAKTDSSEEYDCAMKILIRDFSEVIASGISPAQEMQ